MMKHAFCIMAYHEPEMLKMLVSSLDYANNSIFIHIDKKSDIRLFKGITSICKNAPCFFLKDRINVRWGGESQIKAELSLYQTALKFGPYDYYHLMSGNCLPIKSKHERDSFFEEHEGMEFIGFYKRP
jgi:hypothetical protein